MSHFSKLKVQVKNVRIAKQVAALLGWHIEHVDTFKNPWTYSKESIHDCDLYKTANEVVKMAVMKNGDVIHDAWSMGTDAYQFLQKYSEGCIKSIASREGAVVQNRKVEADGTVVLEVSYY